MKENQMIYMRKANLAMVIFAWLVMGMAFFANLLSDMPAEQIKIAIGIAALLSLPATITYILKNAPHLTKWLAICGITIYSYYNLYAAQGYGSFRALFLFFAALILVALYLDQIIVVFYAITIQLVNTILFFLLYEEFFAPVDATSLFQFQIVFVGCTILLYFITKWGNEMLQKSEERWQFALEGNGDGVWDWHVQTGQVFFSNQWKRMLGYEDDEIGTSIKEWTSRLHPEDRRRVFNEVRKHFQNKSSYYATEHRFRCEDGTYKWILDRGKVITWDKEGRPLRMVCSHTDITEHKELETALREERDRAQELQLQLIQREKIAALGHLTAGIAHEMNSPVGTIQSNAQIEKVLVDNLTQLLPIAKKTEELQGLIEKLQRSNELTTKACNRIKEIVQQLHKFSKLDQAEWQACDLNEAIDNVLKLMEHDDRYKGIEVYKEYHNLPLVYCNASQINQVLMNLVSYGLQSIQGQGDYYIKTDTDENFVYVRFRDTGVGLSEKEIEAIFDPVFTIQEDVIGMELRLSIAYSIVLNHGGNITVKSIEGQGTEFILKMPLVMSYEK